MIEGVRASIGIWTCRSLAKTGVVLALFLAACSPAEGGPPDLADVEEYLDLLVPYLPNGCDPVGLDGDGRGRMVGVAFECPEGATVRIERFDSESNVDDLPGVPTVTRPGWVQWRDPSTGDVVRVVSDELEDEVLMRIAVSSELRE